MACSAVRRICTICPFDPATYLFGDLRGRYRDPHFCAGLIDLLRERLIVRNAEFRARTKNGELRDALLSAEVIEVDGKQCLLGMLLDITGRKRAEKEIHRLASIVESTNDAVVSANCDLIIDHWSRGAQTLLGYRAEEVIGKSLDMLIPPEGLKAARELAAKVLAGARLDSFDTEAMTSAGVKVAVSLTLSPIRRRHANGGRSVLYSA